MAKVWQNIANFMEYFGLKSPSYFHTVPGYNYDRDDPLAYHLDLTARADIKTQSSVGAVILGHDKEDRPLTTSEDSLESFFIHHTGLRAIARMAMAPDSPELFGFSC